MLHHFSEESVSFFLFQRSCLHLKIAQIDQLKNMLVIRVSPHISFSKVFVWGFPWNKVIFVAFCSDLPAELAFPELSRGPVVLCRLLWALSRGSPCPVPQLRMVWAGLAIAKNSQCLSGASQWGADLEKATWAPLFISEPLSLVQCEVSATAFYFCVRKVWQCWMKAVAVRSQPHSQPVLAHSLWLVCFSLLLLALLSSSFLPELSMRI